MGHHHEHHHSNSNNKKTLLISFFIITAYMVVEIIGGWMTNSLALLADAGHMLSDAASLLIALMAFKFGSKAADYQHTYGYKRFEILAAVINGIMLIVISGNIIYEAVERWQHPSEIASIGMLLIAFVGLLVNILVAWIMMRGSDVKNNLNMRGAYLHVISDMLGSVGAIAAALLILFWGWTWADPLASIIVSVLIVRSGYFIIKSSVQVLMEGTPENIDLQKIMDNITATDGVNSVHDLHVWTITSGLNALTCHAVVDAKINIEEGEAILRTIEHNLEHLNIQHITIQLETANHSHNNAVLCTAKTSASTHHH
ncbi:MAG: cation diffusion facilitator family transporter [Capnocytophaga sp.]|nr:cation diffusion facilitator family transporter [Capnocytophaga sp.]